MFNNDNSLELQSYNMQYIFFLLLLPLAFSKSFENRNKPYSDAISADIPLVTFDGEPSTTFRFKQMNDPVMVILLFLKLYFTVSYTKMDPTILIPIFT